MLKEFKDFAMKGNVLDMAIGVIIGGAFGKIVSSLVSDVLMPPIGLLLGKSTSRVFFSIFQARLSHRSSPRKPREPRHSTTGYFCKPSSTSLLLRS